ncbi:MAG: arsenate reductase family protein [Chlorobiaceae bacterium]|nr:arsenate reductase family protein [Chlorobiaceae bacterium]
MVNIIFFEKTGCKNNRRQKEWLLFSGHTLEVVDLVAHAWSKEELRPFLEGKPVSECFNPSAPDVRDGRIDPSSCTFEAALELMVATPLLIRRPLMVVEGRHLQGFDTGLLKTLITLEPVAGAETAVETFRKLDIENCPNSPDNTCTP